ncbi:MAG: Uma2 family endonuclease [Acidobacteriaceae bacterium]|nr:Uma2 family endonuclease [Acidobacteriaceae bacterium]
MSYPEGMATVVSDTLYHTELIDGQELPKPLPTKLHFLIQTFLILTLGKLLPKSYIAGPELNVTCGDDRLVPDVTVVSRGARYANGDLADPPVLCVEILSPGQTLVQLLGKADRLVRSGTPMVWVVWPERKKAWMLTNDDLVEAKDLLDTRLPDGSMIQVQTAEMWAELDELSLN